MFSVVIPLYNKAGFIAKTIRAVQAQRFTHFEVVVVDDGSTDGSGALALEAMAGDARFRYLRVENGGVSSARNRGAAATSKPWLVFLDADDEWFPDFLQALSEAIERRPEAVLVSTNYFVRDARGERPLDFGSQEQESDNYPFFDWVLRVGPPIWTSATAVRRTAFEAAGGFAPSMSMGEDIHLWVRLLRLGPYAFVHRALAVYDRSDATSLSNSVSDKAIASREALIRFLGEQPHVPRAYRDELCKIHFAELLRSRQTMRAIRFWRRAPGLSTGWCVKQLLRQAKPNAARRDDPGPQGRFADYRRLLTADLYRHGGRLGWSHWLDQWLWGEGGNYTIWLRTCVYLKSSPLLKYTLFPLAKWRYRASGYRYGISIPYSTQIGPGLHIAHAGGIVVSHLSVIGRDCTIAQGVTLGWKPGPRGGAPIVGDEVYIGPGAKVIGKVRIGDRAVIGANAVVTSDVPAGAVVGGIPARVIGQDRAGDYVVHTSTELFADAPAQSVHAS